MKLSYTLPKLQFLNQMFNADVKRKLGLHFVLSTQVILFFEYIGLKLLYSTFVEKFDYFSVILVHSRKMFITK